MSRLDDTDGRASPDPPERGRLGFSRAAISAVGLLIALAFLVWVFLP